MVRRVLRLISTQINLKDSLHDFLRHFHDYYLWVGDMRDLETAQIACYTYRVNRLSCSNNRSDNVATHDP